jgi:hypothetical protein
VGLFIDSPTPVLYKSCKKKLCQLVGGYLAASMELGLIEWTRKNKAETRGWRGICCPEIGNPRLSLQLFRHRSSANS